MPITEEGMGYSVGLLCQKRKILAGESQDFVRNLKIKVTG